MAIVQHARGKVDVSNPACGGHLPCFVVGEDKGTFAQGVGYTSYHKKVHLVCWTRHLNGCPRIGVCPSCRTVAAPYAGNTCTWCGEHITMDEK